MRMHKGHFCDQGQPFLLSFNNCKKKTFKKLPENAFNLQNGALYKKMCKVYFNRKFDFASKNFFFKFC